MPSFKTCFHPTWRIELNYSLSRPPLEDINTHSFFSPLILTSFLCLVMEVSVTALFYVVCKSFHIAEITPGENTLILGFLFFFFSPYSPLGRKSYAMEHKLITMKWVFRLYIVPLLCDLRHCFHNSCFSYPLPDWIN